MSDVDREGIMMIITPIAIVLIFGSLFIRGEMEPARFYDCYKVTAPFGVLWVETRGGFVFGCGGISGDLEEAYVVKYFKNGGIYTRVLDAERTPVIVDGTFQLEIKREDWGSGTQEYKIHIPFLPEVNETLTTDWREV